jgi:hypothetical protein
MCTCCVGCMVVCMHVQVIDGLHGCVYVCANMNGLHVAVCDDVLLLCMLCAYLFAKCRLTVQPCECMYK